MTHFSDFSYLQRCTIWVYMGSFLMMKVWLSDRFRCLHPKKLLNGELRTIITIMYILMLLMQSSWDVVLTWIKYSENYIVIPGTSTIIANPFQNWTEKHKFASQAVDYVECVNLSMQTGVLILLQCFWNYLSNTVAKRSFMSSLEFKFYIVWAIVSMISFPVLQYSFRKSELLRETVPLLAYSVEAFIISCLGIRSNKRFNRMLKIFRELGRSESVIKRLLYFKEMNMLISIVLCFYALTLGTLCIDSLTPDTLIARSKIGTDFLMANCNTCATLMWIVGIFIFHPRRTKEEIEADNRSRIDDKISLDTKEHTTIVMSNLGESSKGHKASKSDDIRENRRLSNRITSFINNKRVADSTSVFEEPSYLLDQEPLKVLAQRIIHSSDLPVRTSSRANANIPVINGVTSLNPPQRTKPKQSPSPDSLRRINLPEIEDSFHRGSVSTVSAYGSYGLRPTQENSTQSVENNKQEDTRKNSEESTNEVESDTVYDENWLHRSPTKATISDI